MLKFTKAIRQQIRLRLALIGPSGSGKTWTALTLAQHLGDRVAVIDTEHGSAKKYADRFSFDCLELQSFSPVTYIEAITTAAAAGYPVLVIDSLSHAWMGKDGALELVDRSAKRTPAGNSFAAWRDVTPLHNALVEAMLAFPGHLIVTMRAKTDYFMEEYTTTNGKKGTRPIKVGLAPIQRDGVEYEFDVVGDMNLENDLIITKTRCPILSGQVLSKPDQGLADTLNQWLQGGTPIVENLPASVLPNHRDQMMQQIDQQIQRLGWSTAQARDCLRNQFNQISRRDLNDQQLAAFLQLLQQEQQPQPISIVPSTTLVAVASEPISVPEPIAEPIVTQSNGEIISDLLDELGIGDAVKRQQLHRQFLKRRKPENLSPSELQEIVTAIRQACQQPVSA